MDKAKDKFGDKINVHLIEKNLKTGKHQFETSISNIDDYIKIEYTKKDLNRLIL